jgi:pimeloyl-ACP methyl ester carboxylesterase
MTATETVVLVHGLWVHGMAMALMRRRVAGYGYRVFSYSYPSMRLTLAENAERLGRYCRGIDARAIHLVGHSLGGLIILRALEQVSGYTPGRVVLTGTPYVECYTARCLARLPGGRTALGRSMPEWLQAPRPAYGDRHPIGVIAGTLPLGLGRFVAPDLPTPNDGVVNLEETRLPGMRDHIALNVCHSGMLVSRSVVHQICAFLRDGVFEHRDEG